MSRRRSERGRRRLRRRALTMTAALAAAGTALGTQVVTASPAAAGWSRLPGGRSTYVISMMDGRPQALTVRLATYRFTRDGRVTETYWAWRQDGISGSGNVHWTKPSSGYTTAGCLHACPVRTPFGFQKGAKPHQWTGTYSMESDSVLSIRWSAKAAPERWSIDTSPDGFAGAHLIPSDSNARGWGIGSNASADRGQDLSTIYQNTGWITGPFAENVYSSTTRVTSIGWSSADYARCSSGQCLQSRTVTAPDKRSWYSSYFAANPAVDGRKVYWNNQTGAVQQLENPGSNCISASGGGHTNALLQALDDDGQFVGFVGVEASLNQRKYGQDIVAAYAMLNPDQLSAIGQS